MSANADERTPLRDGGAGAADSSGSQWTDRFFHPFSSGALKALPNPEGTPRAKSKRADRIPESAECRAERPLLTDYHSINDPSIRVRVPKKISTPVKVESKVWFANERTFISYLSMGLLLSTIASGLLFGAKDSLARRFAYGYALISAGILIYGWVIFQRRLTMISTRSTASFDSLWGPLFICAALFIAILVNFSLRLAEARERSKINPLSLAQVWAYAGVQSL